MTSSTNAFAASPPKAPLYVVILAAGKGVRMRSALPKVLHPVAGRPMVRHVLDVAGKLSPAAMVVVIGAGQDSVAAAVKPASTVVQDPPQGTGHAVMVAAEALPKGEGTVLVLFGDSPLITTETLERLIAAREAGNAVVVLAFRPPSATGYGRLVTAPDGALLRIVEEKDAAAEERTIGLCNGGVMALSAVHLPALLAKLDRSNAQGEYYLTDVVRHARASGLACIAVEGPAEDVLGVNSRADLAVAEAVFQRRLRRAAMAAGVTLNDPDTVYLSADTEFGQDVIVGQNVVFGPGVTVASNVTIKPFCHLEGASIAEGAIIGPFARLRPGAKIGQDAHIGNFVEIKNAAIETGAKANHLAYIGDARVGAGANIGAGTITCNYDGFDKHFTDIGKGAFVGTNSSLVAPVKIGDGAYIGSGSVVTNDVPADALALGRGRQVEREGWAKSFRERKLEAKKQKPEGGKKSKGASEV